MTDQLPTKARTASTFGWLCVIAGLLGAVSGVYLATVSPSVGDDRWSYPFTATGFTWIQLFFAVQHIPLFLVLLAVSWLGVVGRSGMGRAGLVIAVAGMVGLTITEVAAIAARGDDLDTTLVQVLNGVYGVVTIMAGVGLVMAGVAAMRERVWSGWHRVVLLVTGIWVFVPMIPALATSFLGARLAITAWMLLFAAVGWAVVQSRRSAPIR